MADRGDGGNPYLGKSAADRFAVERGEVFASATAPPHNTEVNVGQTIDHPKRLDQFFDCPLALHFGADDQDSSARPALSGDGDYVVDCGTIWTGDQGNGRCVAGQFSLSRGIKQSVLVQHCPDPLQLLLLPADRRGWENPR